MRDEKIMMGHGSGGMMMKRLIEDIFFECYSSEELKSGDDAAVLNLDVEAKKLGFNDGYHVSYSTDSFVVTPRFFPGGDIGRLAICGTVNDVSTAGAVPIAISVSFIIEEGFSIDELRKICLSIQQTAKEANVKVVTGDTKVVDKGKCDGIFINTSGIGICPKSRVLASKNIAPGDVVMLTGSIGDHGIAILSQRKALDFITEVKSDAAPLNSLVQDIIAASPNVVCFRDPTRGGVASTLNEFAETAGVSILIEEDKLPIKEEVKGACEMLGLDVCQVANEGKFVVILPKDEAEDALIAARANKYGVDAAIIGEVVASNPYVGNKVYVKTPYLTTRILDMLVSEQLPRIC